MISVSSTLDEEELEEIAECDSSQETSEGARLTIPE
jgi:hypothetical protein